jgi:ATPase subunit of ABC transporter with duplicated ATPase domains
MKGLDALMAALSTWNGGVIVISHDERFITTVAKEVSACKSVYLGCCLSLSSYGCALIMQ